MAAGSAASSAAYSPLDTLPSIYEEYKNGPGKNISIVRSSSAIVSLLASTLLVWTIIRSRQGMKTTHHRLLLGLSVSDILLSLSFATFGATVPSELNYVVWNARGSRASCDALGFIASLGLFSGLLYMCSVNLYYLAKVKFNKTDAYIARKLERWLHGVPTAFGAVVSVVILAMRGMNASINGLCDATNTHDPPHCDGYEDGDTPEGFEIPCGRGRGAEPIAFAAGGVTTFLVPITIGGSLWTIYRSVSSAEQRMAQYGAGALRTNRWNDVASTNVEGENGGGGGAFSLLSSVSSRFGGRASRTTSSNLDSSQRDVATTDVEAGGGGGRRALLMMSSVSSRLKGRASRTTSSNQDLSQNDAATTGVERGDGAGQESSIGGRASRTTSSNLVSSRNDAATTGVEGGGSGRRASFSIPSAVERLEGGGNGRRASFSILSSVSSKFGVRASRTTSSNLGSSQRDAATTDAEGGGGGGFGGRGNGHRALFLIPSAVERRERGGNGRRASFSIPSVVERREEGDNGHRASFSIPSAVERREGGGSGRRASFSILSTVERREGGDNGRRGSLSILSRRLSRRASETSSIIQDSSKSRAVLHKAVAYSVAYFVTWMWLILYVSLGLAGVWKSGFPQPKWQIGYIYVWSFFGPLQGLWTFLIYVQPNVVRKKRSAGGNISWFRAFVEAL